MLIRFKNSIQARKYTDFQKEERFKIALKAKINKWLKQQKNKLNLPKNILESISKIRLSNFAYKDMKYSEDGKEIEDYNETTEIRAQDVIFEFSNVDAKNQFFTLLTQEKGWDISSDIYYGIAPLTRSSVADPYLVENQIAIPASRFDQLIKSEEKHTAILDFDKFEKEVKRELEESINAEMSLREQLLKQIKVLESKVKSLNESYKLINEYTIQVINDIRLTDNHSNPKINFSYEIKGNLNDLFGNIVRNSSNLIKAILSTEISLDNSIEVPLEKDGKLTNIEELLKKHLCDGTKLTESLNKYSDILNELQINLKRFFNQIPFELTCYLLDGKSYKLVVKCNNIPKEKVIGIFAESVMYTNFDGLEIGLPISITSLNTMIENLKKAEPIKDIESQKTTTAPSGMFYHPQRLKEPTINFTNNDLANIFNIDGQKITTIKEGLCKSIEIHIEDTDTAKILEKNIRDKIKTEFGHTYPGTTINRSPIQDKVCIEISFDAMNDMLGIIKNYQTNNRAAKTC